MVTRICSCFVQEGHRFSIECRILALEANVVDSSHIFVASTVVVLEEQVDRSGGVPESSVQCNLGNFIAPRHFNFLRRLQVRCCAEVQVLSILEQLQSMRSGVRIRCAYQDGVEFDLSGEAIIVSAAQHFHLHCNSRYMHQQLLIGITLEFRRVI